MKLRKSVFVISIALMLFVVFVFAVYANTDINGCTDIVVGKKASTDGSVITSHTVDGRYDSRIIIVPAADHEPGEMAPVYEWIIYADYMPLVKLGEIPQVAHTFKYFNGAYPYANEHQVIIGETTLGGAEETKNSEDAIMTIEQLEVFALQRAKTAREAIKIMGELAEKYGYRESCWLGECLTVTDPNEAWVFEIYGVGPLWTLESEKPGAVWCAQRVPDDHITCIPNMSRIAEINPEDTENFIVCDNYIETAVELELYDPDSGKPFIWREAYGGIHDSYWGMGCRVRIWRVYSELAPSRNWVLENAPDYPFSIKPEKKVSYQDIISFFRDTYAGTQYDMTEDPDWFVPGKDGWEKSPLATPQVDGTWRALLDITYYRPIARYYCSYYFVSQARDWMPNEIGGVVWFGLDNPENSPFIPVYTGINAVPESWAHLDRDKFDRESAWWAFALVDDLVNNRYGDLKPELDEVLVPMQEDMFAMQESIEQTALDLYKTSPELAQKFLTNYTCSLMNQTERVYWDLVDKFLFELNNN
jgi:dipeptidase